MPNIRLKRYTGATWEEVEVQTDWSQILNKPATFTPTAHTHDVDELNTTGTASASTFLRGDGTWATPSDVDTNNYLTGVSGSGNGTVTFTRQGLSNLTFDASHTHTEYLKYNPDGDGIAIAYDDSNPTINGQAVGGGHVFGADGNSTNGYLNAKVLLANGITNSVSGYYVGAMTPSSGGSSTQVIDGSGNWVGNVIDAAKLGSHTHDDRYYTETEADSRFINASGDTMTGTLTYTNLNATNSSTRDKIRLYTSSQYAIGMQSGVSFGGLNDWAMTFQFNNNNARGFWWGDESHITSQGAMALTTNGLLTVASGIRVGYGESDTTIPSSGLDVSGNIAVSGTVDGVDVAAFKTSYDNHTHDDRYYTESESDSRFARLSATTNTFSGEVLATKFIISNDSDGGNEVPNWGFSEYNNKPCVSSEYLSDSYYPIYHEGNKPTVDDVTGAQSLQTRYYYDTYGTDSLITNGANGTTSWTKTTGTTTPSGSTGPQNPYTNISGFYYTEASGVNNTLHTMILSVPTISNAAFMSFGFWWHMYGANMGTLTVSYTTNGSTYIDVWSKTGDQGNVEWQQAEVAIPRTALGIRINGTTGAGFASDMCIANMHIDMRV